MGNFFESWEIISKMSGKVMRIMGFFREYFVSDTFQSFQPCYGLFWVIPVSTSNDLKDCFDLLIYYKPTLCRFYYKECKNYHKSGQLKLLQNEATLFQSREVITK